MVTSVLASYRGYDTMGEVAVIFTAGMAVLMLLGRGLRSNARRSTAGGNSAKGNSPGQREKVKP
ncbi:MAG: hypothetical protein IH909_04070 [Proteobacteria bacterium]|nr:hypothetical protein [Pseudomonadota bacterium]